MRVVDENLLDIHYSDACKLSCSRPNVVWDPICDGGLSRGETECRRVVHFKRDLPVGHQSTDVGSEAMAVWDHLVRYSGRYLFKFAPFLQCREAGATQVTYDSAIVEARHQCADLFLVLRILYFS